MCGICGCSSENAPPEGAKTISVTGNPSEGHHHHHHLPEHRHADSPNHVSPAESTADNRPPESNGHIHAIRHQSLADDDATLIEIEQDILHRNSQYADNNRAFLQHHRILCLNLVSSPGSGKTTLLEKTISALNKPSEMYVIEGDQQTSNDADRIRETGAITIQINTGRGCHLDAHTIGHALDDLRIESDALLFIENVGNLVCPASFDLGERHKVALLSVTEGEDKPIKYPDMFAASSVMLVNKIDLLPYLNFDLDRCIQYARQVNPEIHVITLSAQNGQGMDEWLNWIATEQALISNEPLSSPRQTQTQLSHV